MYTYKLFVSDEDNVEYRELSKKLIEWGIIPNDRWDTLMRFCIELVKDNVNSIRNNIDDAKKLVEKLIKDKKISLKGRKNR
ncbi:MAG: hypothetical protein AB1420_15800 [Bacillota bacterium]